MKIRSTALVKGFRQSTPYVNAHRGKTMVIMLGGEAVAHKNFGNIINDIALMHSLGIKVVVVYGARPQINQLLEKQDLTTPYHKNIRITMNRLYLLLCKLPDNFSLRLLRAYQ